MNVGLDFKALAHDIASRSDVKAAVVFLRENPAPDASSRVDAHELRLWADVAFTAGSLKDATRIYSRLTTAQPDFFWPYFQLGRISLQIANVKDAVRMFSRAVAIDPKFAWSWFELCRCYHRQQDVAKLKEAAAGFAAADAVALNQHHADALTAIAHYLFEQHHREEPYRIYKILLEQGFKNDLIETRHAEYFIWRGDFGTAIELLDPLRQNDSLGDWGLRSLACAFTETGRLEQAEPILAAIVGRNRKNVTFIRDYVHVLHRRAKRQEVDAVLAAAASNLDRASYESLHLAHLSETNNYAALIDILGSQPSYGGAAAQNDIMRAAYDAAYRQRNYPAARFLIEHYTARFGSDMGMLLCQITIAFATRDWATAQELLSRVSAQDFNSNVELRVKRFEYFCLTGALSQAADALKALEPISRLPKRFLPPVMRYYAEINDWTSAYSVGMQMLDVGFDFEQAGYLIFRAVRKTGMHVPALRQIEQIEALDQAPSLKKLRTIIMEDMIHNGYMLEDLIDDPHLADLGPLQQRLFFKKLVLQSIESKQRRKKRFAVYFCTNEDYLCPTFVSLVSLAESNPDIIAQSDVFVVVDEKTLSLVRKIGSKLFKKLNIDVQIKTSADILEDDVSLKVTYGLFTGGHSLAEAAYYRIYFAKALLAQGRHEKALYIDSDTVVQGSLHDLFFRSPKAPLLARLEQSRPEVDAAIRAHDLKPGRYFNSGILLFDLQHSELAAALERTIDAIRNSRERLMFHDQCALNIGFADVFQTLDDRFNFFVKPEGSEVSSDAAIVHYLDRPKPWDPAYPREVCRHWFANWHKLAVQIGGKDAMALYQLSNKG